MDDDYKFKRGHYVYQINDLDEPPTEIIINHIINDTLYFTILLHHGSENSLYDVNVKRKIKTKTHSRFFNGDIIKKEVEFIRIYYTWNTPFFPTKQKLDSDNGFDMLEFNAFDLNTECIKKDRYSFKFSDEDVKFKVGYYEIRLSYKIWAKIHIKRVTKIRITFSYQTKNWKGIVDIKKTKDIYTDDDGIEYIKDFERYNGFDAVTLNHYSNKKIKKEIFNKLCKDNIIINGKQIPEEIEKLICEFI